MLSKKTLRKKISLNVKNCSSECLKKKKKGKVNFRKYHKIQMENCFKEILRKKMLYMKIKDPTKRPIINEKLGVT